MGDLNGLLNLWYYQHSPWPQQHILHFLSSLPSGGSFQNKILPTVVTAPALLTKALDLVLTPSPRLPIMIVYAFTSLDHITATATDAQININYISIYQKALVP